MTFALLPVKSPANAKQRLGAMLPAAGREKLARALFEEAFAAVQAAQNIDRVAVVTVDRMIATRAEAAGALVFEEDKQVNHSRSADHAAFRAMELGAATVVMLPIDVPLIRPGEIDEIVRAAPRPGVLIVPSEDGTGTNALVRTPPDAIESRFGLGSYRAHLDQARERGLAVVTARPPGITFDIDTPEDVRELLRRAPDSRIARLLEMRCASKS